MVQLGRFVSNWFPCDVTAGCIGSIDMNIRLIHMTGLPLLGQKIESVGRQTMLMAYSTVVCVFVLLFYTGCEIYDLILVRDNVDLVTRNAALTLTHIAGLLKVLNVLYHQKDILQVTTDIKMLTKMYVVSVHQRKAFMRGDLENKLALLTYATIVVFTGLQGFVLMQIMPHGWAGEMFPYRVKLPNFLPPKLQYFYMGLSVLVLGLQIVSVDFLNINMINQIRFQLICVNLSFDELVTNTDVNWRNSLKHMKNANIRLNSITLHHCALVRLRNKVEAIFRLPLLLQFFTSVSIFALTGFQVIAQTQTGYGAILIQLYCGCILLQLFSYCWFGNEVYEQSKTLALSGYNSSWYCFDQKFQKSLLIFLTNAGRPFLFTAGGFMGLSLPSFTGICSKSYTFIAVLQQIYKK